MIRTHCQPPSGLTCRIGFHSLNTDNIIFSYCTVALGNAVHVEEPAFSIVSRPSSEVFQTSLALYLSTSSCSSSLKGSVPFTVADQEKGEQKKKKKRKRRRTRNPISPPLAIRNSNPILPPVSLPQRSSSTRSALVIGNFSNLT